MTHRGARGAFPVDGWPVVLQRMQCRIGCLQVFPCGIARPDAVRLAGDTTTDVAAVADDQGRASGFRLDARRFWWLLCRG